MASEMGTIIKDIEHVRGDTLEFLVVIKGNTGTVSAVSFGCRTSLSASSYAFQKTLGNGITSLGDGKYDVKASPADTASLAAGLYDYDLQFTISDEVFTPMMGKLHLLMDVTHA